jgi:hypothetical protein
VLEHQVLETFAAAQQDMRAGCWEEATAKLEWLAQVNPTVPPTIAAVARATPVAGALERTSSVPERAGRCALDRPRAPVVTAARMAAHRGGAGGPREARERRAPWSAGPARPLVVAPPGPSVSTGQAGSRADPVVLALVAVAIALLIVLVGAATTAAELVLLQAIMGLLGLPY